MGRWRVRWTVGDKSQPVPWQTQDGIDSVARAMSIPSGNKTKDSMPDSGRETILPLDVVRMVLDHSVSYLNTLRLEFTNYSFTCCFVLL